MGNSTEKLREGFGKWEELNNIRDIIKNGREKLTQNISSQKGDKHGES